jgi:3-hydroxyacyl-[acyl-carrier-protein] dehydratase
LRFRLMPFPADMRTLMESRIKTIGLKPEPAR